MTQPTPNAVALDSSAPTGLRDLTVGSAGTLLLLILVFVCYAWSTQGGYIWDDDAYVLNNPTLHTFAGLSRIWTDIGATPQYYPLTFTSFWLENQLFGLKPAVSHIVNVLLHAGSTLLLWKILRRLSVPGAWVAAAVFAVHPIQVESVAWISERKNTLSMMLGLASTWIFLRYARVGDTTPDAVPAGEGFGVALPDEPKRLYRLFLALFVLALLSKTTMVVLPAILLAIVWWKRGRVTRGDWLAMTPAFVLGAVSGALTTYVEQSTSNVGATGPAFDVSIVERVMLMGQTLTFYAYKILWPFPIGFSPSTGSAVWPPFPISFNYERWTLNTANPLQWLPLAAVVATLAALFALRGRLGRGPLTAALVFVLGILPASGLVMFYPLRYAWVADHFSHVGAVGLFVGFAAAATTGLGRFPRFATGGTVAMLVLLSAVTFWHSTAFRDVKVLWERTWKQNDRSWLAALSYGVVAMDRANDEYAYHLREGDREKAVKGREDNRRAAEIWFQTGLELNPEAYEGHTSLGILAAQRGQYDVALGHYQKAREMADAQGADGYRKPDFLIGELLAIQGKTDEAIKVFTELEALEPKLVRRTGTLFARIRTMHGNLLRKQIKSKVGPDMPDADRAVLQQAMNQYITATDLSPEYVPAKIKLASILIDIGSPVDALQQLREALEIDPNNPDAKLLTAIVARNEGLPDAAAVQLQNLLATRPDYLPAHLELAKVLQQLGLYDEAMTELTNTARDFPNSEDAKLMLAELQAKAATQPAK